MLSSFQCTYMGLCWPTRRPWVPFQRRLIGGPGQELVADGLALSRPPHRREAICIRRGFTRPRSSPPSPRRSRTSAAATSCATRRAARPARGGTISVTVPKFSIHGSRAHRIRHRRSAAGQDTAAGGGQPAHPGRSHERLRAARLPGVITGLRQVVDPARLIREFVKAGNPWPSAPRREATFAIELAEPAVFSPRAPTREEGDRLLDRFSWLIRHPLEPDEFERAWDEAAAPAHAAPRSSRHDRGFADRALARFPGEPRFLLARAIASYQRLASAGPSPAAVTRPTLSRTALADTIAQRDTRRSAGRRSRPELMPAKSTWWRRCPTRMPRRLRRLRACSHRARASADLDCHCAST